MYFVSRKSTKICDLWILNKRIVLAIQSERFDCWFSGRWLWKYKLWMTIRNEHVWSCNCVHVCEHGVCMMCMCLNKYSIYKMPAFDLPNGKTWFITDIFIAFLLIFLISFFSWFFCELFSIRPSQAEWNVCMRELVNSCFIIFFVFNLLGRTHYGREPIYWCEWMPLLELDRIFDRMHECVVVCVSVYACVRLKVCASDDVFFPSSSVQNQQQ